MRRSAQFFMTILMLFVSFGRPASALAAMTTQPTTVPDNAPLMITAYQAHLTTATTDSKGKVLTQRLDDIDTLELYNSGDTLVQLADWHVVDAADITRELLFSSTYSGALEPGHHVVLAKVGEVAHPTYTINGWTHPAVNDRAIPGIIVTNDAYRVSQTDIKVSDILEKRNFGVSSYLTTFVDALPYGTPSVDTISTDRLFDDGLYRAPDAPSGLAIVEIYPYASDCSPFDTSVLCGDYVKVMNTSDQPLVLDGLVLRTDSSSSSRTSSNTITLSGELPAGAYRTIAVTDDGTRLSLTNSGGYVWVEDMWGTTRYDDTLTSYDSAGSSEQGYAYAMDAADVWWWTTTPQPDAPNRITLPIEVTVVCSAGKYLNPETGRCRNVEEAINELAACDEGYERNPLTNRCRKVAALSMTTLTPCGEGQERNPTTNRCRSIASAVAELLPCDEGYERNPATNRCRKITVDSMPVAAFPVQPFATSPQTMIGWWIGGGVAVLALGYATWEWRRELREFGRRVLGRRQQ